MSSQTFLWISNVVERYHYPPCSPSWKPGLYPQNLSPSPHLPTKELTHRGYLYNLCRSLAKERLQGYWLWVCSMQPGRPGGPGSSFSSYINVDRWPAHHASFSLFVNRAIMVSASEDRCGKLWGHTHRVQGLTHSKCTTHASCWCGSAHGTLVFMLYQPWETPGFSFGSESGKMPILGKNRSVVGV